jgi:hypothetical protein
MLSNIVPPSIIAGDRKGRPYAVLSVHPDIAGDRKGRPYILSVHQSKSTRF